LPLILLVVVFYFLLIRPQRKRQQEQLQMQNSLVPGTRVMTTTGLFATVIAVQDDELVLEVAPGVETRWTKGAIGRVVTPVEEETVDNGDGVTGTPVDEPIADVAERGTNEGSADKKS
jgi:preprotein translocase subunit YajC